MSGDPNLAQVAPHAEYIEQPKDDHHDDHDIEDLFDFFLCNAFSWWCARGGPRWAGQQVQSEAVAAVKLATALSLTTCSVLSTRPGRNNGEPGKGPPNSIRPSLWLQNAR